MEDQGIKIGIIGVGMVGVQLDRYFREVKKLKRSEDLFLYDIDPKKSFSDDINRADIIFVSVPTPRNHDGSCNISAVESTLKSISAGKIVVIKSTVPPGTTEQLQEQFPEVKLLFNPEFLTESQAWEDMVRPDRQIVGFTKKSIDAAHLVLSVLPKAPFMSPWGSGYKKYALTATEAEAAKLFANAYFAMKVMFANHIADACKAAGADYEHVRQAISADYRIGDSHMDVYHGKFRGFGGYCLPKDLEATIQFLKSVNIPDDLFSAVRDQNIALLASQDLKIEDINGHVVDFS